MSGMTIGIIAGSGPEAGIDLWRKMLVERRCRMGDAFRGDVDAPAVTIFSVPGLGLSMDLREHEAAVWNTLEQTCLAIADHCDAFAIACNTIHHYAPRIEALGLSARFVSMVDVARAVIARHGASRVALLGADPVIALDDGFSPYACLREAVDIELPGASLQQLILDIKRRGGGDASVVMRFDDLLETLSSDLVLLACTELPLIETRQRSRSLVDLNQALAEELVTIASGADRCLQSLS